MVMGMTPDQQQGMLKLQELTKNFKGIITADIPNLILSVELKLSGNNPKEREAAEKLIDQFSGQLAAQLNAFFGISGKIVKKSKK